MAEDSVFVRGHMSPGQVEAFRRLFAFLFALLTRLEVHGREHLPASGGFILSPNHLSQADAPLIFTQLRGRKMTVFAADTYRRHPFYRWILESLDVIWVHRGAIGPSTIRAAIRALRAGSILGVAPEGTRSTLTHALQEGKTGAAFLALATGVPIVPTAITHTHLVGHALLRLRRQPVGLKFGRPLRLSSLGPGQRPDAATLQAHTTEIMCQIAALLPPEYHGVYAQHPRLLELLREAAAEPQAGEEHTITPA